jgi:hypothetical protein
VRIFSAPEAADDTNHSLLQLQHILSPKSELESIFPSLLSEHYQEHLRTNDRTTSHGRRTNCRGQREGLWSSEQQFSCRVSWYLCDTG